MSDLPRYETLEHTADIKIRAYGRDLPTLFENAAYALMDTMVDLSTVRPMKRRSVSVEGRDLIELMNRWLAELHYLFEVNSLLFCRFKILTLSESSLTAELSGERYSEERHQLKADIKAVTYHQLNIREVDGRWRADILFDI